MTVAKPDSNRSHDRGERQAPQAVYPALHRLEDLGLLTSDWQPAAGRRRRLYRISERGVAALHAQRRDWRALVNAIESVLGPKATTNRRE